VITNLILV